LKTKDLRWNKAGFSAIFAQSLNPWGEGSRPSGAIASLVSTGTCVIFLASSKDVKHLSYAPIFAERLLTFLSELGRRDLVSGFISHLPDELRPFVPQFRVFVINLWTFQYGSLPGRPATQAIRVSLKVKPRKKSRSPRT